ncbi:MAG: branched-chain amino acid transporter membrane protein [Dehalococcoidia bacterium]|nr:MAG: branched-chain amino acid transporter membrane protein [Dehalococcoidia bacterium]
MTTVAPEREPGAQPLVASGRLERGIPFWVPIFALLAVVMAILPLVGTGYAVRFGFTLLMSLALAASWNLLSGYTGYVSFAHAGFFGIGAYTAALLIARLRWDWSIAAVMGGLLAFGLALVIGVPALRLRGPYFAIAMLGFAETARVIVTVWEPLTRGGAGIFLPPTLDLAPNYWAMEALAVGTVALTALVANSRHGLRLIAIREDEVAAEVGGINTTFYKTATFAISAAIAGVAGGLYAFNTSFVEPTSVFSVRFTVYAIAMTLFGGRGTILGPIIGTVILSFISERLWVDFPFLHTAIFGLLIVVVLLFMPGGLVALLQQLGWLPRSRRY